MTMGFVASSLRAYRRALPILKIVLITAVPVATTNVLQWWSTSASTRKLEAERDRTLAEIERLRQDGAEAASRSLQAWLGVLERFKTREDQLMVLEALRATSPHPRIRTWAREQIVRRPLADDAVEPTSPASLPRKASPSESANLNPIASALCPRVEARPPRAFAPDENGQLRQGYADLTNRALAQRMCERQIKDVHNAWLIEIQRLNWECECFS